MGALLWLGYGGNSGNFSSERIPSCVPLYPPNSHCMIMNNKLMLVESGSSGQRRKQCLPISANTFRDTRSRNPVLCMCLRGMVLNIT
ncbi:hypothetical protein BaRGS_00002597 [Batillaria attramentaria]|uniref:Uncharacterized protein n=1 Tax=Batillaria attramentaria TaxID=370345 RepID=A0ABD0M4A2_9CAEN